MCGRSTSFLLFWPPFPPFTAVDSMELSSSISSLPFVSPLSLL